MDFEENYNKALAFQSAQNFQDADKIYRELSITHDNHAELFYAWAVALFKLNKLDEAVSALRKVTAIEPDNSKAYLELGRLLQAKNQLREAAIEFEHAVRLRGGDVESVSALGPVLVNLKQYAKAIPVYESIKEHYQNSPEAWANLGNVYFLANQFNEAVTAFRHALVLRRNYPYARQSLGACLLKLDQVDESIAVLSSMIEKSPMVFSTLATAYGRKGDLTKAVEFSKKAIDILPESNTYIQLGDFYQTQQQLVLAEAAFRNAVTADPANIEAYINLAFLLERMGQLDAATDVVVVGMKIDGNDPYLLLANATIKRRCGKYESAINDLTQILKQDRASVRVRLALDAPAEQFGQDEKRYIAPTLYYELGSCYDRMNNADEAYRAFSQANVLKQQTPTAKRYNKEKFLSEIKDLLAITPAVKASAERESESLNLKPGYAPVFLVGFPRSGTTLMGSILDSHPAIQVLDEAPLLEPVQKQLASFPGGYPHALKGVDVTQLKTLQDTYYAAADELLKREPNAVLVDKLPLNLVKIVTLWRLFPDAKFVLILRHPCDVCLSCFMQHFAPNEAMNNFYSLEDAAALYAVSMQAWEYYAENLPINVHQIRYEDVLDNFGVEINKLLDFIGVPWDDAVKSFDTHARAKQSIATPSYHQVTQPLYQHANLRWQRYQDNMRATMPVLEPYIDKFGYGQRKIDGHNIESAKGANRVI